MSETESTDAVKTNLGIKETKELVSLTVSLANAGIAIAKDGKISLDDISLLWGVLPKFVPALESADKALLEIKDLDGSEGVELIGLVATELAVDNEKAKKIILASLKVATAAVELVEAIV